MKILVIRFSSIGDIVLCSPVLRLLRQRFPSAEIWFLTKQKYKSLVEFNPHLSGVLSLDDSLSSVQKEIKQHNFGLIIDLHLSLRSRWISLLAGKPVLSYAKENWSKWLLVRFGIQRMSGRHVVDRYVDALKPLGISPDQKGLEFYPCDCEEPVAEELPAFVFNQKFTLCSIGGTHQTKKMPAAKWIELCQQLPGPVVLAGSKEDLQLAEEIIEGMKKSGREMFDACGKFTLGGTAYLIRWSALVISHDTGLMHIAAAFGKPVVCIWGNTVPVFGFEPYRTPHFNLEVANLNCRPCARTGFEACPKGHFRCMQEQNFAQSGFWEFAQSAIGIF